MDLEEKNYSKRTVSPKFLRLNYVSGFIRPCDPL